MWMVGTTCDSSLTHAIPEHLRDESVIDATLVQ